MPARLLILKLFSQQHALILHSVFIHSNIFDQKYQKFMFFRLQYAHFWALILVSIKFSMRHVYYFHKFFQQACLFRPARLFCTLEYLIKSYYHYRVNMSLILPGEPSPEEVKWKLLRSNFSKRVFPSTMNLKLPDEGPV